MSTHLCFCLFVYNALEKLSIFLVLKKRKVNANYLKGIKFCGYLISQMQRQKKYFAGI